MIQIQITCEKPEELKDALEGLLRQFGGQPTEAVKEAAPEAKPEQAKQREEPRREDQEWPDIDVCRSIYFDAKKRGVPNDEVKKVLTSLGAEKISSIPEDKRAAFVEAVRAMGR